MALIRVVRKRLLTEARDILKHCKESFFNDVGICVALDFDVKDTAQGIRVGDLRASDGRARDELARMRGSHENYLLLAE